MKSTPLSAYSQVHTRAAVEAAGHLRWRIVQEFVGNGISGAIGRDKRPGFDRLLKAVVPARSMSLPFRQLTASVDRRGTSSASSRNSMVRDAICICISKPSTRRRRRVARCSRCSASFPNSSGRSFAAGQRPVLARARLHGTKSGEPIVRQPRARQKVEVIRAELAKGTGIINTARLCGTGVSVVQRIKRETASVPA